MTTKRLEVIPITGLPKFAPGDDVSKALITALDAGDHKLQDGDVVAVAQKIISKAENRLVNLADIKPRPRATYLAQHTNKDPRFVETVLQESESVLRHRKDVLIVIHKLGFVHANAGIDRSNVDGGEKETVLLFPEDPDASADGLRKSLQNHYDVTVGVIINDSMGRAWRRGTTGQAIGCAGLIAVQDLRGQEDLFGQTLETTEVGVADELASAASFVMGQRDEGVPAVIIRGAGHLVGYTDSAASILRDKETDLFR